MRRKALRYARKKKIVLNWEETARSEWLLFYSKLTDEEF